MHKKPIISIIAAIGKNRELGKDNKLLWYIPEDLKKFKLLTTGHTVIMGRKTFESIGKPLPNRTNIVVTRNRSWTPLGCTICYSLAEAINLARQKTSAVFPLRSSTAEVNEVFIIGGAEIYRQAIQYADKLYLTLVNKEYPEADTFFPDYLQFKQVVYSQEQKSGQYEFKWVELVH